MVIGKSMLDQINKEARQQQKEQEEKLSASSYWTLCPSCGKKAAKRQILMEGCWACGWKGTEEEIELAKAKRASGQESKLAAETGYKTRCPGCGRLVIAEELREKGCYICGWLHSSPSKGGEASPERSEGTRWSESL